MNSLVKTGIVMSVASMMVAGCMTAGDKFAARKLALKDQMAVRMSDAQIASTIEEIIDGLVAIPGKKWSMGKTEVTQLQWEAIMGENPSTFNGSSRPVENVSWNDCQEFIKRLNEKTGLEFRLPTEEEWEYACRAGSTGDWGNLKSGVAGSLDVLGWYESNSNGKTQKVAQKEPNAWGLYDMHGNVGEWTSSENGEGRMNRGGSWGSVASDCAASNRRNCFFPDIRGDYLGFRLVFQDK